MEMRTKEELLGPDNTIEYCQLEVLIDIRDLFVDMIKTLKSILSELEQKNRSDGNVLIVEEDRGGKGFRLSDHYSYPFFVLELIQKKETEPSLPQIYLDIIDNGFGCAHEKEALKKLVTEILKQK